MDSIRGARRWPRRSDIARFSSSCSKRWDGHYTSEVVSMAVVTILNDDKTITRAEEIASALAKHDIDYERWTPSHPVADDAPPEEILNAYSREIEALKARG